MKRSLLILAIGISLSCSTYVRADDAPPAPPAGGGEHHGFHGPMLTQDERTELKTAHDAAIKADPSLETEGKALQDQFKAYEKKMHDAMVAADPKVEPILAKFKGSVGHHGPPAGDGGGDNQ